MDHLIDKKIMAARLGSLKLVKRLLFHWLTPVIQGRGKRKTQVERREFELAQALMGSGHLPAQLPTDGGPSRTGWPKLEPALEARLNRQAHDAERVRLHFANRPIFQPDDIPPAPEKRKIHWLLEQAGKLPIETVPLEKLHLDPARFQWKSMNCQRTGTNTEEQLGGTFVQSLAGLVTCYQEDEKLFLLDGHHRYDLAMRSSAGWLQVRAVPADVFSVTDAHILGMLLNLADGHGSIRDQIRAMDKIQSLKYGTLDDIEPYLQNRGGLAFTLFAQAVPELIDTVVNDRIATNKAQAIAQAAPHHHALQVLSLKEALRHPQLNARVLGLHVRQLAKLAPKQDNNDVECVLWAPDEDWLQKSRQTAQRVDRIRREIDARIRSARGAAANPHAAASLGVHVSSQERTQSGIQRLIELREQLEGWRTSNRIISKIEAELEKLNAC